MKNFFTRKSLRGKISILTIITSLLAMILVLGAVFSLNYQRYSKDELLKFKAQAELFAKTLGSLHPTPAELKDTGLEIFFSSTETVLDAYLEIGDERMPSYHRAGGLGPVDGFWPSFDDRGNAWVEFGEVKAHVKVVFKFDQEQGPRGNLYVIHDLTQARMQFLREMLVVSLLATGAVSIAVMASRKLQHFILDPVLLLAEATDKIASDKDYSTRVFSPSKDEIGQLYHGFNRMLEEIEYRDETIRKANDELEDRVQERTAAMQQAKAETESINKQLLDANQKLKESIEEAQQLAIEAQAANKAKSEFLAAMSHEIRTPMNGVIGFTNLLLNSDLSEMQKDYAQTIKNSGESLLIIINGILDFSKIEAGKFFLDSEPFDMAGASEEVIELLSAEAAAKNLELKLFYEPDALRRVVGDPGRVKQIMLNLISNALKFTEIGSIHVRVEKMTVSGHREGLKVSVTDTGIGIPADKQSALFEKFSQSDNSTTRKYGGTGLGLAICRELVSMMRGEIGFQSEPGIGSVFWFTLAFCELESEKEADESTVSSEKPAEHGDFDPPVVNLLPETFRVLLVEDNAVNQKLAGKILERMGCSVDMATNGKEAVSMFANLPYNIIFMDCQMPEMDGYEATRKIRSIETAGNSSNGKQVPIIAITANAMRGDREKCLEEGMDDYIAKPVDARQIGRALERWRHHV